MTEEENPKKKYQYGDFFICSDMEEMIFEYMKVVQEDEGERYVIIKSLEGDKIHVPWDLFEKKYRPVNQKK